MIPTRTGAGDHPEFGRPRSPPQDDPVGLLIADRLDASPDRMVRITAVSAYEMVGGAVALIDRRKRERRELDSAFHLLRDLIEYLGTWRGLILPYDAASERIRGGFPARPRRNSRTTPGSPPSPWPATRSSGPATWPITRGCPGSPSSVPRPGPGSLDTRFPGESGRVGDRVVAVDHA